AHRRIPLPGAAPPTRCRHRGTARLATPTANRESSLRARFPAGRSTVPSKIPRSFPVEIKLTAHATKELRLVNRLDAKGLRFFQLASGLLADQNEARFLGHAARDATAVRLDE